MRYGPDDKFWVVTDPTPESEAADILFQASLKDLELQFKGGLTMDQHPTLFTEKAEAEVEAYGRMVAMRASRAIARRVAEGKPLNGANRIEVLDGNGKVLFEAELT
ncbi:MAG: hypothetical protein HYY16_05610 [Planctomycetes bacterium]|nr:hypothetical protein [Planctomycetota bacterium]